MLIFTLRYFNIGRTFRNIFYDLTVTEVKNNLVFDKFNFIDANKLREDITIL